MRAWSILAVLGGCGMSGQDFTVSGRVAAVAAASRRSDAAPSEHQITHVMAVDPETASPHRSIAAVGADGSFTLTVEAGRPYVFVLVDSTASGAEMAVAIVRAQTLDTLSPQFAGHLELGDVMVDPDQQTATPGIGYDELLASLGLSEADAAYLGSVDDLSLRYANPDIDGNGVIDLVEHHDFGLDFHVRSNLRRGSAAGSNFTVADITDQFLPDNAVPVYNLTSAYVLYPAAFDSTEYVTMAGAPSIAPSNGGTFTATNADGTAAMAPTSFSSIGFGNTRGWGADYDLERVPGLELPGSSGMPATLRYGLGASSTTLTFTNVVTRTKASLTEDGTLAVFVRLATDNGAVAAIDYRWLARAGGSWVPATAQQIALTISSDGGYVSVHQLPRWSNEVGVALPPQPTGTVAWTGPAIHPSDICGLAVSYDDKLGMRHFIGGVDANPGVTCAGN